MKRPAKILVVSLSRMGDLVQSIPFLRRLRAKYPEAELQLLAEDAFAGTAALLPEVDRVRTVSLRDLLPALASGRNGDLARATAFYRDFLADLQGEGFDEVWNLTHTRPATVLNFLLAEERGCGVTLDREGLQRVNSSWLRYFFATNLARPWCQFNLVDIYANCVDGIPWHMGRNLSFLCERYADALPDFAPNPGSTTVALHPGASHSSKQWPVDAYRSLAARLLGNPRVEIILIGGQGDTALERAFAGLERVSSFVGRTAPVELAALLSRCQLLISNDSGPMHFAAAVGTPVLDITVGSALASETAPYGPGHLVIEPESDCFPCSPHQTCPTTACAAGIRPATVAALAAWQLGWAPAPEARDLSGMRVYRTTVSSADGLLDLERLFSSQELGRDSFNALLRPAWLNVLEPARQGQRPHGAAVVPELATPAADASVLARKARGTAYQISQAAADLPRTVATIQNLAALLQQDEAELDRCLLRHEVLRSLRAFLNISRASLHGENLRTQAAETAALYDDLNRLLRPLCGSETHANSRLNSIEDRHENLA